jgi:hypothetical protein
MQCNSQENKVEKFAKDVQAANLDRKISELEQIPKNPK